MSLQLLERHVDRVLLIDDDAAVRHMYRYPIEELELMPEEVTGPIWHVDEFVNSLNAGHDAVVCDYNLNMKNYSLVNGDVIVAKLYQRHMPAILCSRMASVAEKVRGLRRYIPAILGPGELSDETVREGFTACLREFEGFFSTERKPWRTLIRVESCNRINDDLLDLGIVVPGWDPHILLSCQVRRQENNVFREIEASLKRGNLFRAYAQVNIGCEHEQDLYIIDWTVE